MIKVKKTGRCRKMKKTVVVTASVRDLIINIRTKGKTLTEGRGRLMRCFASKYQTNVGYPTRTREPT